MNSESRRPRLLIFSWETQVLLPVIRSLGVAGFRSQVICGRMDPVIARSRYLDSFSDFVPQSDAAAVLDRLRSICRHRDIQLLMPTDEAAIRFASAHQTSLREFVGITPVPTVDAFDLATHKGRLTAYLQDMGLPCPRTLFPGERELVERDFSRLRFPVLAKATQSAFGIGIYRCGNLEELHAAMAQLEARRSEFIVQELIEGPDVDCSVLAEEGRVVAWTTQRGLFKDRFVAPAGEIMMEPHLALLETVSQLVKKTNWSGPAHVDTVLDRRDGSYRILELNGRYWGSLLASTAAGVNFPAVAVRRATGRPETADGFATMPFYSQDIGWRRLFPGAGRRYPFRSTLVPFFLRDPGPELAAAYRRRFGATANA